MYLVNPDEENVMSEKNAPEEKVDEEIEMEKATSLPLKKIQAEPSGSTKEDEQVVGEQVAPRGYTTPVSSSGAPTRMEIDHAPGSLASHLELEENKNGEHVAHEEEAQAVVPPVLPHQIVPLVLPQQTKGEHVMNQVTKEVFKTPTIEGSPKEKSLVP